MQKLLTKRDLLRKMCGGGKETFPAFSADAVQDCVSAEQYGGRRCDGTAFGVRSAAELLLGDRSLQKGGMEGLEKGNGYHEAETIYGCNAGAAGGAASCRCLGRHGRGGFHGGCADRRSIASRAAHHHPADRRHHHCRCRRRPQQTGLKRQRKNCFSKSGSFGKVFT